MKRPSGFFIGSFLGLAAWPSKPLGIEHPTVEECSLEVLLCVGTGAVIGMVFEFIHRRRGRC